MKNVNRANKSGFFSTDDVERRLKLFISFCSCCMANTDSCESIEMNSTANRLTNTPVKVLSSLPNVILTYFL